MSSAEKPLTLPNSESANAKNRRDLLDEALHRHRIHDGFPDHRRRLAVSLDIHGFSVEDVDILADSIGSQRRKDSDSAAAILAKLLSTPKIAKYRVEDVRKGSGIRKSKFVDPYPGKSLWKQPGADDGLGPDNARNQRIAYALIHVERKAPSVAAEVIGCTEDQALEYARLHKLDLEEQAKLRGRK